MTEQNQPVLAVGDVLVEEVTQYGKGQKIIVYWRDWAGSLKPDGTIAYNHRHTLTYYKAGKRKGCPECRGHPPEELTALVTLQKLRVRDVK